MAPISAEPGMLDLGSEATVPHMGVVGEEMVHPPVLRLNAPDTGGAELPLPFYG